MDLIEDLSSISDKAVKWLDDNPIEKAYYIEWLKKHPAAKAYLEILKSLGLLQFSSILSLILSTIHDTPLNSYLQWSTCHPQACRQIQEWAYAAGSSQLSPDQARILALSIISDEIDCCWHDLDVVIEGVPESSHRKKA